MPDKQKSISQINRKRDLEITLSQLEKNILTQKNKIKDVKMKHNK